MAANTSPIFTVSGDITWNTGFLVTANMVSGTAASAYDGTSSVLIHAAGLNGSFVQKIVCEAGGTNTACVLRIYVNNGSDNTVAANNSLYYQYSLPATTQSNIVGTAHIEIPISLQLPTPYRLYAIVAGQGGTTTLTGGWKITCVAGEY